MARVHIIGTGGTIASRSGPSGDIGGTGGTADTGGTGGTADSGSTGSTVTSGSALGGSVASDSVADLIRALPPAADAGPREAPEVTTEDVMTLGSYRLGLPELLTITAAALARAGEEAVDGVVVAHGTDTLEETAFLVDLVNGTGTTVVFTGAQLAADQPDSDGPRNLRQAATVALDPRFRGMGALIAFDGRLQTARGARKAHTTASQPFDGGTTVGLIRGEEIDLVARPVRLRALPLPGEAFGTTRVEVITAYPGSDPTLLQHAAQAGAAAIVLAGTGVGNAGSGYAEAVAELVAAGIPVVLSTRVPAGPMVPIYGNGGGVDLIAAGAVSAGHLNPFQARILTAALLSGPSGRPTLTEFTTLFSEHR
ncbi:asparaginase [Microbacterium sp. A93]|uniref:asparaginase n=1 Tax=Microbacterium sp. A93 TaxID=3450716 RepID=UPI003F434EFA